MSNMPPQLSPDEQKLFCDVIKHAPDDAQFVEYGCGGSTILFAGALTGNQRLFSIEHNPEWYTKVAVALAETPGGERVSLHLLAPFAGLPVAQVDAEGNATPFCEQDLRPYGHPKEELPFGLEEYIHAEGIDIDWNKVCMVLVDGVARGAVLCVVRDRVHPGVMVIIHDYVGREWWYDWAIRSYTRVGRVNDGTGLLLSTPETK